MKDIVYILSGLGLGFIGGLILALPGPDPRIETCKKQHNVYQCELVAVPKGDK